jgi:carotenoid 1,2-hydratase
VRPQGPRFDLTPEPGGYVWWYVDALSDDGRYGITIIALIGSVFSPYYAWARRRERGDPHNFCALNVALYGADRRRWAMTERGRAALQRSESELMIGPSSVSWDNDTLTIRIDEVGAPLPRRVRGVVRVHPSAITSHPVQLDAAGRHHWWPIAPDARVEVALDAPELRWSGNGYLDTNSGDEPLEAGFRYWDWSRARLREGSAVLYDVTRRNGERLSLALRFDGRGGAEPFEPPPPIPLPSTFWWRIPRATQTDADSTAELLETLEDTPFYARSTIRARWLGEPVTAFHESLSLDRFDSGWVQMLLPFRMPRLTRSRSRSDSEPRQPHSG